VKAVKRTSGLESNPRTFRTVVNADRRHEAGKLSILWGRCVALLRGYISETSDNGFKDKKKKG
jgi:hypothetical protein